MQLSGDPGWLGAADGGNLHVRWDEGRGTLNSLPTRLVKFVFFVVRFVLFVVKTKYVNGYVNF